MLPLLGMPYRPHHPRKEWLMTTGLFFFFFFFDKTRVIRGHGDPCRLSRADSSLWPASVGRHPHQCLALRTQPGGRILPHWGGGWGLHPYNQVIQGCQRQTPTHSRAYGALMAGMGTSHMLCLICGDLRYGKHPGTHRNGFDDAVVHAN